MLVQATTVQQRLVREDAAIINLANKVAYKKERSSGKRPAEKTSRFWLPP